MGDWISEVDLMMRKEICWFFDSNMNVTIKQVARHFDLTEAQVKQILMDDAWGDRT